MSGARREEAGALKSGFLCSRLLARLACVLALTFLLVNLAAPFPVSADENNRRFPVSSTTMADHWQLARWDTGASVCELYLKQAEIKKGPSPTDILEHCGKNVYQDWMGTVVCEDALKGNPAA